MTEQAMICVHAFTIRGNLLLLGGRKIGWITRLANGKKIYVSIRNRLGKEHKGHYFEMFKGFGVAESVLDFLERNLFDEIHLKTSNRETLISNLTVWRKHGIKYQKDPFEPQIILPEEFMTKKTLALSQVMEDKVPNKRERKQT